MAQSGDQKDYTIKKINTDETSTEDHNSRNYTGRAMVAYPTGDTYEGFFNEGLREGLGIYIYAGESGNKYEGEWLKNKKHGIGKMIFGGEGEYFGRFENGRRHGEGIYKSYKSKNVYSGSWKHGHKHGKGTYIFDDTKMKIVGEWVKGEITEGRWIFPNGTYLEGKFANNFPKGVGTWYLPNENVVKGEFLQEQKERDDGGEGMLTVINWKTDAEVNDITRLFTVIESI